MTVSSPMGNSTTQTPPSPSRQFGIDCMPPNWKLGGPRLRSRHPRWQRALALLSAFIFFWMFGVAAWNRLPAIFADISYWDGFAGGGRVVLLDLNQGRISMTFIIDPQVGDGSPQFFRTLQFENETTKDRLIDSSKDGTLVYLVAGTASIARQKSKLPEAYDFRQHRFLNLVPSQLLAERWGKPEGSGPRQETTPLRTPCLGLANQLLALWPCNDQKYHACEAMGDAAP